LIKVFEQVDVSVQQTIPAQCREVDVAAEQPGEQRIEDVRLRRIDAGQGAANVQLGHRRLRLGSHRRGIERGVETDRCAAEQGLYAASKTGGHGATGNDFHRCGLRGIHCERAHARGWRDQGAARGSEGVASIDNVAIAHGALPGVTGGAQARQAIAATTDGFEGGVVHHPLQLALFHVQAAGVDH
jgi:hypothetical protein